MGIRLHLEHLVGSTGALPFRPLSALTSAMHCTSPPDAEEEGPSQTLVTLHLSASAQIVSRDSAETALYVLSTRCNMMVQ